MKELHNAILWYACAYQGDWTKIGRAIKNKEPYKRIHYPYSYTTFFDKTYPEKMRRLRYPPWILFYQGNLELFDLPAVGIIGARKCSIQAKINTQTVVDHLKKRYCIVSGLAKGIDGTAHQNALDHHTIGIIGCGIDRVYPKENAALFQQMRTKQLIVSEYPMGTAPLRHHFPWRNRLIAASVDALIVIEAAYKSGTMLTVNECLHLSIPVYCLPTAFENDGYPGCNHLIESGAYIIANASQLEEI